MKLSTFKPDVRISRSKFDRSCDVKTTFSAGRLIPFFVDEVLPGDTFTDKTSMVVRMTTPIFPIMDDCFLDYFYFFVPNRLVWDNWEKFMGENDESQWTSPFDKPIPTVEVAAESVLKNTVFDYFGLPATSGLGGNTLKVNALPFRGYQLVWNKYFRDENLQTPMLINRADTGDSFATLSQLLPVCKVPDYFTTALPAPQKGPSTLIPGVLYMSSAPVTFSADATHDGGSALHFANVPGTGDDPSNTGYYIGARSNENFARKIGTNSGLNTSEITIDNAYAYLDGAKASGSTINDLRQAFAVQRMLERDARGGTRYQELLQSHFGVTSPDSRIQVPECIGRDRFYINMQQVVQQSSTDTTSPQGNVSGLSKTVHSGGGFSKSFTEHGYIIGVLCVRTKHTYQYGINRLWSRRNRLDFYFPELANIGEQAVLNKEIYAQGTAQDDEVFGYQEAWAEYRYKPSVVTGAFRHSSDNNLDSWHYADIYDKLPKLSDNWIRETDANINRTLAVQSSLADQFLADIYVSQVCTRPLPLYSVPGLSGHY